LQRATALRASDVHLFSGEAPSLRIDGSLRTLREQGAGRRGRAVRRSSR